MADYISSYTGPEIDAAVGAVPGKEGALETEAASGASLTAALGKYYDFAAAVGTLAITLPAVSAGSGVGGIMAHFTTGASPAVTIASADNADVDYYEGFAIEASTEYELNFLFNGTKWIVSYGIIE